MENKYFTLNNGVKLPAIGFGTYKSTIEEGEAVITRALEAGYYYFDTAAFYGNEEEIGAAIKKSGVKRSELFLSSKVWKTELGYEKTKASFEASLRRLNTDYLDLFLIHWPKESPEDTEWRKKVQGSWSAMEDLYREGKIRAIGLSNFLPYHVDAVLETAEISPMVDQLELHVGYLQAVAVGYLAEHKIIPQAWSPLGRMRVKEHPSVVKMAEKYGVTSAQFLLGFLVQNGIAVIPKSSSKEHMLENQNIYGFTIEKEDNDFLWCMPQAGWSGEHPDMERVQI